MNMDFYHALKKRDFVFAKQLLKKGADPNFCPHDHEYFSPLPPLFVILENYVSVGEVGMAKALLDAGADPNELPNPQCVYPCSHTPPIGWLLPYDPDCHKFTKHCMDLARLLIKHGADVDFYIKDCSNNGSESLTSFVTAAEESFPELGELVSQHSKIGNPTKYIMVQINSIAGRDMKGIYFMQQTGNEPALEAFLALLEKNSEEITVYEKKYTEQELRDLMTKYRDILGMVYYSNCATADNFHILKLSGKFSPSAITAGQPFEEWWDSNFDDTKYPDFSKRWENVESMYFDGIVICNECEKTMDMEDDGTWACSRCKNS